MGGRGSLYLSDKCVHVRVRGPVGILLLRMALIEIWRVVLKGRFIDAAVWMVLRTRLVYSVKCCGWGRHAAAHLK
jgi:hypothetical protein